MGIRAYLSPAHLKKIVTDAARAALSSEVSVGRVSLRPGGINIYDIAVAKKGGFNAGTAARIDKLCARMSFSRLLLGKLAVRSLLIDGMTLDMERQQAPPRVNTRAAQEAIASSNKGLRMEIMVDEVEIRSCALRYSDSASSVTITAAGLSLFADYITDPRPTLLKFSGNFEIQTASASFLGPLSGKVEVNETARPLQIIPLECASSNMAGVFTTEYGSLALSLANLSVNRQEDGRLQISARAAAKLERDSLVATATATVSSFLIIDNASYPRFLKAEDTLLADMEAGILPGEKQVSLRLGNTTLRVKEFYPSGKFSMEGEGESVFSLPAVSTAAAFSVRMSGAPGEQGYLLSIPALELSSGRLGISLTGEINTARPMRADIRLRTAPFRSHDLRFAWRQAPYNIPLPQTTVAGTLSYDGETVEFSSASATAGPLIASGEIKADMRSGRYKADADIAFALPPLSGKTLRRLTRKFPLQGTLPQTSMSLHLNQENTKFNWSDIILKAGSSELKAAASGAQDKNGLWQGKLVVNGKKMALVDLLGPIPAAARMGITGQASGSAAFIYENGKIDKKMDMTLARGTLAWDKVRLSEMKGRVRLSKGVLSSGKFEGLSSGKPLKSSFRLDLSNQNTVLALKAEADTIDMSGPTKEKRDSQDDKTGKLIDLNLDIKTNYFRHNKVDGKNVAFKCALRNVGGNMDKLSGSASIRSEEGKLLMLEKSENSSSFLRVVALPFTIVQKITRPFKLLPDMDNTTYSGLTGEYTFVNGVMTVEKTELHTAGGEITASGTIDLAKSVMNLKIVYKLKGGLITRLTTGPITVEVSGPIENPVVKTGLLSMLNNPIIDNTVGATLRGGKKLLEKLIP